MCISLLMVDERSNRDGSIGLLVGQDVPIHAEREGRRRVLGPFGDDAHLGVRGEQVFRVGVAQACPLDEPGERS